MKNDIIKAPVKQWGQVNKLAAVYTDESMKQAIVWYARHLKQTTGRATPTSRIVTAGMLKAFPEIKAKYNELRKEAERGKRRITIE